MLHTIYAEIKLNLTVLLCVQSHENAVSCGILKKTSSKKIAVDFSYTFLFKQMQHSNRAE